MSATTNLLVERDWMLFVDGENFTKRGQEVLKVRGEPPLACAEWRRDVFLWLPGIGATSPFLSPGRLYFGVVNAGPPPAQAPRATRAFYYASSVSDEPEWTETRLQMRDQGFEPRLFKRVHGRSKAVDLALATDVLTLAGERAYEVAVIFAGDGDYVPVVEAVKRLGRHVVVGFFEKNGLNPELRIAADAFVDLTDYIVDRWRDAREQKERDAAQQASRRQPAADESPQ